MGILVNPGYFDDYDDIGNEPQWEQFDRIIHVTKKAILYGFKNQKFWLPKSVHHVETALKKTHAGSIVIEHWVVYNKEIDEAYIKPKE